MSSCLYYQTGYSLVQSSIANNFSVKKLGQVELRSWHSSFRYLHWYQPRLSWDSFLCGQLFSTPVVDLASGGCTPGALILWYGMGCCHSLPHSPGVMLRFMHWNSHVVYLCFLTSKSGFPPSSWWLTLLFLPFTESMCSSGYTWENHPSLKRFIPLSFGTNCTLGHFALCPFFMSVLPNQVEWWRLLESMNHSITFYFSVHPCYSKGWFKYVSFMFLCSDLCGPPVKEGQYFVISEHVWPTEEFFLLFFIYYFLSV